MPINNELLAKVRDHILAEPRRYIQEDIVVPAPESPCGTACCIFGWGAVLSGMVTLDQLDHAACDPKFFSNVGERFGFTRSEIGIVCDGEGADWPEEFGAQLRDAQDSEDKEAEAQAGADYLDYIISTGKVT